MHSSIHYPVNVSDHILCVCVEERDPGVGTECLMQIVTDHTPELLPEPQPYY